MPGLLVLFFSFLAPVLVTSDTNVWKGPIDSKITRHGHTLTPFTDTLIFGFGGYSDLGSVPTNDIFEIDITDNNVTVLDGVAGGIPPRSGHGAVKISLGEDNPALLVFGGIGQNDQIYGDTWSLSKTNPGYQWKELKVTGSTPPPRTSHCMAVDSTNTFVVLFGGQSTSGGDHPLSDMYVGRIGDTNDTFIWTQVTQTFPTNSSPPTINAQLSYDETISGADRMRFYLTGGQPNSTTDNLHIWQIDIAINSGTYNATWKNVAYHPSGLPGREGHFARQLGPSLYLWGGSSSTSTFSVVNTDENSWFPLDPLDLNMPPLLSNFGSAYATDSQRDLVVIHGGLLQSSGLVSSQLWVYTCDSCSRNSHCNQCAADNLHKCVWCSAKGRCISASQPTASDPKTPLGEPCAVYVAEAAQCAGGADLESCASYNTCSACAAVARCGWCQDMRAFPLDVYGCFEGTNIAPYLGVCQAYAGTADQCEGVEMKLNILYPSEGDQILAMSTLYLSWYTQGLVDEDSLRYNIYVKEGSEEEKLIGGEHYASGGEMYTLTLSVTEPQPGQIIFKRVTPEGEEEVAGTLNFTLEPPTSVFSAPIDGEKITDTPYIVQWERNVDMLKVDMTLTSPDSGINQTIFSALDNDGNYTWALEMGMYDVTQKFILHLFWRRSSVKEDVVHLCSTGSFTIDIAKPTYTISVEAPGQTLPPGSQVLVTWGGQNYPDLTNVFLMRGEDLHSAVPVAILKQNMSRTEHQVTWLVDVNQDSNQYFFKVEDSGATLNAISGHYTIEATSMTASVQVIPGDRSKGLDISSTTGFYGETARIGWVYKGGSSRFSVTLKLDDGNEKLLTDALASSTTQYDYVLPATLKHGSTFKAIVNAYDFHGGVIGTTPAVHVYAPGSIGVKSVPGIVMTIVFGLASVAFALVFYFCFFKKSRLGGFQQI